MKLILTPFFRIDLIYPLTGIYNFLLDKNVNQLPYMNEFPNSGIFVCSVGTLSSMHNLFSITDPCCQRFPNGL